MAADRQPFEPGAPKIWTIAPGADFLGSLARVLADAFDLRANSGALAGAIIYVPNRRSARALTLALFDSLGGAGTLLPPDIRTLGDLETDDAPPVAEAAMAALPPALSPATRLGVLAQLAGLFHEREYGRTLPPASALASAMELSRLLEQASLSDEPIDWSELESLVPEADLAGHWQNSTRFLSIITEMWPQWLAEHNAADPFARRLKAAEAMAAAWRAAPPTSPVIVAGSTGATPAGRLLMQAALELPQGLVVFPGLDTDLTVAAREKVARAPSHPQNALIRTLSALGVPLEAVASWPGDAGEARAMSRRRLVHEALAPADDTADWREILEVLAEENETTPSGFARDALDGLSILELPNEAAEADAAALLLRGILEEADATAALVTPDAGLARRVGARLARWGISVPPSAGQPLGRTRAGSLIALCARWAADPADPVCLSAVLKHPFVRNRETGDLLDLHFLRGPRRWATLDDLAAYIEAPRENMRHQAFTVDDQVRGGAFVRELSTLVHQSGADFSAAATVSIAEAVQRLSALAGAISETPLPWTGEDGAGASTLLQRINEMGAYLPPVTPGDLAELIERECARLTVSLGDPEHPRLSVWGPLESRLQSADLIVLAGLNEGVWPEKTPPDAFLPRKLRGRLGLPDPDQRLGLSAHDFAQLACAPRVVMLYASRRDDAPAVASRWVWRLRTLVQGAIIGADAATFAGEQRHLPGWVRQMQDEGIGKPLGGLDVEPKPSRRPEGWPWKFSVTRVDRFQRDPYSIWAEDVLGLRVLDPLNGPVQANLRGTAVHKAIERLEREACAKTPESLAERLEEELAAAGESRTDWLSRRAIWEDTASWFLDWRATRDVAGGLHLEVSGKVPFEVDGRPFVLSAQADRIEVGAGGALTIVDFKTGSAPSDNMVRAGFDQQMPLQAVIAMRGGFEGVAAAPVTALEYVEFKGKPKARQIGPGKDGALAPSEVAAAAEAGVQRLIAAYRSPEARFLSAPRVQFVKYDYGFNLLARRAEWTSDTSDGEGDDV